MGSECPRCVTGRENPDFPIGIGVPGVVYFKRDSEWTAERCNLCQRYKSDAQARRVLYRLPAGHLLPPRGREAVEWVRGGA